MSCGPRDVGVGGLDAVPKAGPWAEWGFSHREELRWLVFRAWKKRARSRKAALRLAGRDLSLDACRLLGKATNRVPLLKGPGTRVWTWALVYGVRYRGPQRSGDWVGVREILDPRFPSKTDLSKLVEGWGSLELPSHPRFVFRFLVVSTKVSTNPPKNG